MSKERINDSSGKDKDSPKEVDWGLAFDAITGMAPEAVAKVAADLGLVSDLILGSLLLAKSAGLGIDGSTAEIIRFTAGIVCRVAKVSGDSALAAAFAGRRVSVVAIDQAVAVDAVNAIVRWADNPSLGGARSVTIAREELGIVLAAAMFGVPAIAGGSRDTAMEVVGVLESIAKRADPALHKSVALAIALGAGQAPDAAAG